MNAIKHKVKVHASAEALYEALSTEGGLAAWWTPMVKARPEVGSVATFRFGADGAHGPDMSIEELSPAERVRWRCVAGPWEGMDFDFRIEAETDTEAVLRFEHSGWPESGDFYMHCNSKWGFFLGSSLKRYLETGEGLPHPQDPDL